MKRYTCPFRVQSIFAAIFCVMLLTEPLLHTAHAMPVYSQESHVQRRYVKSTNLTLVTSDSLYVINMPTQFMQLQLTGRYPNQGPPTQMPDKITLLFNSYTTAPLYQQDEAHRLVVKADAEVLDLGLMSYSALRENGKDNYMADQKSRLGISSPIPPDALVRTANKDKALTLESMSVSDVPLSQLTKLAQSSQVLMKIGDTVFALTATQMSILREFAASITPAGGVIPTELKTSSPKIPSDVPSDTNNASLDTTLKWLKKELPRNAAKEGIGVKGKIEVMDFNSCQLTYRFVPLFKTSPVSSSLVYTIIEYQFNLADINPETVRASDLKGFSMLSFDTRNQEPKIKITSRANDNGMAGRTLDEKSRAGAVLNLRDADSAAQIKEAFVHAIKLCRPQP
jgi:hypothetical protein